MYLYTDDRIEAAANYEVDEEQRRKFQDLHKSIAACDEILGSVETNLTNFRNDLASVSADIESLQDRSLALNRRLENREAVEKALAPYVEELSLSPDTIHKICNGHVDESWIKLLSEVDKRDAAHKRNTSSSQPSKASEDLGPLLGKLISKVRTTWHVSVTELEGSNFLLL